VSFFFFTWKLIVRFLCMFLLSAYFIFLVFSIDSKRGRTRKAKTSGQEIEWKKTRKSPECVCRGRMERCAVDLRTSGFFLPFSVLVETRKISSSSYVWLVFWRCHFAIKKCDVPAFIF